MKNLIALFVISLIFIGCDKMNTSNVPKSDTGIQKMSVEVRTNDNGHTVEQENIAARYALDNEFGAIKHLYIISSYSGQVLLYSTVKGKVTSSSKRLTPLSVVDQSGEYVNNTYGFDVSIGGHRGRTTEVLQDDGTYGSSVEYLYWWDSRGVFHQQYIPSGALLHISDQPLSVKSVIINIEAR